VKKTESHKGRKSQNNVDLAAKRGRAAHGGRSKLRGPVAEGGGWSKGGWQSL